MGDLVLAADAGADLVAEDSQARQSLLLTLVLGHIDQRPGAGGLGLGRTEHLLVGLELELQSAVAVRQQLVLGLDGPELLLAGLVLLLEGGDQLLQLHAADLGLQLLRQLRSHLLLVNEVDDDRQHEVDEVHCALDDVFFGLGKALGWVPASTLQEKVVDAAVQLAVQLAQVLAAVTLRNTVLLALVIGVRRDGATLALPSAELLEGRLAVDVLRRNQSHELRLREVVRPLHRGGLLGRKGLLPGALSRVGRRGRRSDVLACPRRLEVERVLGPRSAGTKGLPDVKGVEGPARQWLNPGQRRQATVPANVGASHTGSGRFQRTGYPS